MLAHTVGSYCVNEVIVGDYGNDAFFTNPVGCPAERFDVRVVK